MQWHFELQKILFRVHTLFLVWHLDSYLTNSRIKQLLRKYFLFAIIKYNIGILESALFTKIHYCSNTLSYINSVHFLHEVMHSIDYVFVIIKMSYFSCSFYAYYRTLRYFIEWQIQHFVIVLYFSSKAFKTSACSY